jgi:hypothetical protein
VRKILIKTVLALVPFLPTLVFAQSGYIGSILTKGSILLRNLVVVLVGLATCWFIWNVIQYSFAASDNKDEKNIAKEQMIKGIIAIAVMVSIWGIIEILKGIFGVDSVDTISPNKSILEAIVPNVTGMQ